MHKRSHAPGCWSCLQAWSHRLMSRLRGYDRSLDTDGPPFGAYWWTYEDTED